MSLSGGGSGGCPRSPAAPGPGRGGPVTFPESGLGSALLPAAWSPRRSGRAWADTRTDPRAHWSGCVCSATSNFSRIPLVSPGRASGHRGEGSEGRGARGGGGRPDGRGEGRARRGEQGRRLRSGAVRAPRTPRPRRGRRARGRSRNCERRSEGKGPRGWPGGGGLRSALRRLSGGLSAAPCSLWLGSV